MEEVRKMGGNILVPQLNGGTVQAIAEYSPPAHHSLPLFNHMLCGSLSIWMAPVLTVAVFSRHLCLEGNWRGFNYYLKASFTAFVCSVLLSDVLSEVISFGWFKLDCNFKCLKVLLAISYGMARRKHPDTLFPFVISLCKLFVQSECYEVLSVCQ